MKQLFSVFYARHTVWLVMIAVAAYGLYFIKFQVLELQRQTASIQKELDKELEHMHVVQAEWAYLTRPDRLQALVREHTPLKPVIGMQVQQVASLPFPPADEGMDGDDRMVVARYKE